MSEVVDANSAEWHPVRPEVADGVFGKILLEGKVKVVLTRVVPGGRFRMHLDKYAHMFYFLSGEGIMRVGKDEFAIHPGLMARIDAGEQHSYKNTGDSDMLLISLNLQV